MPAAVSALEKTKPTISIVGAKKTVKTVLTACFFILARPTSSFSKNKKRTCSAQVF
jgi:hypothetical protein